MGNLDHLRDQIFTDGIDPDLMVKTGEGGLSSDQVLALRRPFSISQHEWHKYFEICYLKEQAINDRLTQVLGGSWQKIVTERVYMPAQEPSVKIGEIDVFLSQAYPQGYEMFGKGTKVMVKAKAAQQQQQPPAPELANLTEEFGFDLPTGATRFDSSTNEREVRFDVPIVLTFGYIEYNGIRRDSVGGDVLLNLGKEYNARLMNTYKGSDTDLLKRCARYWGVGLYLTQLSAATTKVVNDDTLRTFLHEQYPDDKRYGSAKDAAGALFESLHRQQPEKYTKGSDVVAALTAKGIKMDADNYYAIERRLLA